MYKIQNRRYIGSKIKLLPFIDKVLNSENIKFNTCADLFAGTGVVSEHFLSQGKKAFINDNLFSNYVFYNAWLSDIKYNPSKISKWLNYYNQSTDYLQDNYFSDTFSDTYFSYNNAKFIGSVREHLETIKDRLTQREYYIILSSLLYCADKIANTVGHYEAFLSSKPQDIKFKLLPLEIKQYKQPAIITCSDANAIANTINADLTYIDPPYNSRQYINFYHILENIAEWKKPSVSGKTLKFPRNNKKSNYSKSKALSSLTDLLSNLKTKYILLSYNNTYKANSEASNNKIKFKELENLLSKFGKLKIYDYDYKFFNSGKTFFDGHKEFLFLCKVSK
ncbi:MAG: DNA adenine methylase [Campylobacteraceae bacterium]|jgi:adenine-specific DNA-methyltransferase|nr:DNA adenine methylase [Campylobacteraceae bacterium]